ncbi:MAG: paraquat-inducible protein A, partial [Magnetococcales bacterium]|nr:paraquat-inducible protein A [Magnetococcales bacterium]
GGRSQGSTLMGGVEALAGEGMWDLVALVFGTSMLFPFLLLAGLCHILLPLKFGRLPWRMALILRLVNGVTPWAMMGVYLLGVLVAYVKLIAMATVVPGVALYAFFGLILATSAARASLDPRVVWNRLPVSP